MLTLIDKQFERDDMQVSMNDVVFNKTNYLQVAKNDKNDQMMVDLPYSKEKHTDQSKFIFRLLFKPETGDLWGFNKFECDKSHF